MGCVEGRESGSDAIGRAPPELPRDTPRTAPQDEAYSPRFVFFDERGLAHLPQEVPEGEPISEPTLLKWSLLYISSLAQQCWRLREWLREHVEGIENRRYLLGTWRCRARFCGRLSRSIQSKLWELVPATRPAPLPSPFRQIRHNQTLAEALDRTALQGRQFRAGSRLLQQNPSAAEIKEAFWIAVLLHLQRRGLRSAVRTAAVIRRKRVRNGATWRANHYLNERELYVRTCLELAKRELAWLREQYNRNQRRVQFRLATASSAA